MKQCGGTLYREDNSIWQWLPLEWGPRWWFTDRLNELHIPWVGYGRPALSQVIGRSSKEGISTW